MVYARIGHMAEKTCTIRHMKNRASMCNWYTLETPPELLRIHNMRALNHMKYMENGVLYL